jgi:drug/metabolite transporter (DMT)-like permease
MLTPKEKRFLKYWNDQKEGGKTSYVITYTIGWSVILFVLPLATSFVVDMYSAFKLYQLPLWAAIVISILLGYIISQYQWNKNEKKAERLERQEEAASRI